MKFFKVFIIFLNYFQKIFSWNSQYCSKRATSCSVLGAFIWKKLKNIFFSNCLKNVNFLQNLDQKSYHHLHLLLLICITPFFFDLLLEYKPFKFATFDLCFKLLRTVLHIYLILTILAVFHKSLSFYSDIWASFF